MDYLEVKLTVEDGVMRIINRRELDKALPRMNGNWRLIFERDKPRHNARLRGYFFGKVVKDLQERLQLRKSEVYEFLMWKFDPQQREVVDPKTGEILITLNAPGSIRLMTDLQLGELIEDVCQWAAERLELYIEPPDKNWREKLGLKEVQPALKQIAAGNSP